MMEYCLYYLIILLPPDYIKVPHAGQIYAQPKLTLLNHIIIQIIITLDLILAC